MVDKKLLKKTTKVSEDTKRDKHGSGKKRYTYDYITLNDKGKQILYRPSDICVRCLSGLV